MLVHYFMISKFVSNQFALSACLSFIEVFKICWVSILIALLAVDSFAEACLVFCFSEISRFSKMAIEQLANSIYACRAIIQFLWTSDRSF